jgi:hypothetical protein
MLVDEVVANIAVVDLAEPLLRFADRCRALRTQREPIKSRTRYHWWP